MAPGRLTDLSPLGALRPQVINQPALSWPCYNYYLTDVWYEAVGMVAAWMSLALLHLYSLSWHNPVKVYTLECAQGKGHFVINNKMATCLSLLCVIHSLNGVPFSK